MLGIVGKYTVYKFPNLILQRFHILIFFSTLLITTLLPIIQISTLFLAIGRIPYDMKIGIVNEELGEYKNCDDYLSDNPNIGGSRLDENGTCVYNGLGCKFVHKFQSTIHSHVSHICNNKIKS